MIDVVFMAESCSVVPVGYCVADCRDTLKHVLNIAPDAEARVNGQTVGDQFVPGDGATLEFVLDRGEKGMPWSSTMELAKGYKLSPKRARKVLEKCADRDPSCCLLARPQYPTQPHKLYDEEKVKNDLAVARNGNRYKPPPCELCDSRMRVVRTVQHGRYLKCEKCGHKRLRERLSASNVAVVP